MHSTALGSLISISAQNPNLPECDGTVVWNVKAAAPIAPPVIPAAAGCKIPAPFLAGVNPKNNGLQGAFVWFEPAEKGTKFAIPAALQKPAKNNLDIDQPNCEFEPHALALREGQTLTVKNTSNMAHNFKWDGDPAVNAGGNNLLPAGGQFVIANLKADRLPVTVACNIHSWMKGTVRVYDHPYFAVTDADGKFTMPAPPSGAHVLKIWHESKGWLGGAKGRTGQTINVTGQPQKLGDFQY